MEIKYNVAPTYLELSQLVVLNAMPVQHPPAFGFDVCLYQGPSCHHSLVDTSLLPAYEYE